MICGGGLFRVENDSEGRISYGAGEAGLVEGFVNALKHILWSSAFIAFTRLVEGWQNGSTTSRSADFSRLFYRLKSAVRFQDQQHALAAADSVASSTEDLNFADGFQRVERRPVSASRLKGSRRFDSMARCVNNRSLGSLRFAPSLTQN